jgi:3-deoxy-7-phosphoheptulonate synthase
MYYNTDDNRIEALKPLISPAILMEELPTTEAMTEIVAGSRIAAEKIIRGEDDRLLAIVGPCSIHDVKAAKEYAAKLAVVREQYKGEMEIIMRVYFEKPRTRKGWKGLINDPYLDESFQINHGLRAARGLLRDIVEMGLPAGCEFLDTISPQFVADLVSWGAIGARTTESQIHRELASGLSAPIGFKNGTDGNVKIAIDAIHAAQIPHHFLSVTKQSVAAIVHTKGNDSCHVILRGDNEGPNYDTANIDTVCEKLIESDCVGSVMVDCSHGNSGKVHSNQPKVASDLAQQIAGGSRKIMGVMIESHLFEGNQKAGPLESLEYGKSITDACLGWDDTLPVLKELAQAVKARRGK